MCGEAKALTMSGRAERAKEVLDVARRRIHQKSWVQDWISMEGLRAESSVTALDRSRKENALMTAMDLMETCAERRLFSLILALAEIALKLATELNSAEHRARAEKWLAEANMARGIEPEWVPTFAPLPGDVGWEDRVNDWAIEIEKKKGAPNDSEAAAGAYFVAVTDGVSRVASLILRRNAHKMFKATNMGKILCALARTQKYESVNELLSIGVDPIFTDKEGLTPLIAAANGGATQVVKCILEGCRERAEFSEYINHRMDRGVSALHLAANSGHVDIVSLLLANGADSLAKTVAGSTPLILATREKWFNVVQSILESNGLTIDTGTLINEAEEDGETPLIAAALAGDAGIIAALAEGGASLDPRRKDGITAIIAAAGSGNDDALEILLSRADYLKEKGERDINDDEMRIAFGSAAMNKNDKIIKCFLQHYGEEYLRHLFASVLPNQIDKIDIDQLVSLIGEMGRSEVSRMTSKQGRLPLPVKLPNKDESALDQWPCVIAQPGSRSFADLLLRGALPEEVEAIGKLLPSLEYDELEKFDRTWFDIAELPFWRDLKLVLLRHTGTGVGVPFIWREKSLILLRRENETLYDLLSEQTCTMDGSGIGFVGKVLLRDSGWTIGELSDRRKCRPCALER